MLSGMGIFKKAWSWVAAEMAKDLMNRDIDHHCEHQPIGSCSEECEAIVMGQRW